MVSATSVTDELYGGYQALAIATLDSNPGSEVTYEMGYLDGFADALGHAGWAADGKRIKSKAAFPLHRAKQLRSRARANLKTWRDRKVGAKT